MKIGFIGSGKVGFSLGKYFAQKDDKDIEVIGFHSKTLQSAKQAAEFTGSYCFDTLSDIIKASDTIFITTPDSVIKDVWEQIQELPIENKLICHCSGSLSSAVFSHIDTHGAFGYSVHPLQAISSKEHSYQTLSDCLFTIEGSPEHLTTIKHLFTQLGNPVQVISAQQKTLYHAAAVMVSNHMQALMQYGLDMLIACGFKEENAWNALLPLALGNMQNMENQGLAQSLTGPVERNDSQTVANHLSVLQNDNRELYLLLAKKLLSLAQVKNPNRDYTEIITLINGGLNQ